MEEVRVEVGLAGPGDRELAWGRKTTIMEPTSRPSTWTNRDGVSWSAGFTGDVCSLLLFQPSEDEFFGVCPLPQRLTITPADSLQVKRGGLMVAGATAEVLAVLMDPHIEENFEALRKTLARRVKKGHIW